MIKEYFKDVIVDIETNINLMDGGKIICISVMNTDTEEITSFYYQKEEKLLIEFLKHYNKSRFNHVIGFNLNFDRRFILAKCMKYNLEANCFFMAKTTDIMTILKGIDGNLNFNRPGKLSEWANIIGAYKIKKSASNKILYEAGKIEEIINTNISHVMLIFQLYTRIKFVLGV